MRNFSPLFVLVALLALAGCERVKKLAQTASKEPTAAIPVPPGGEVVTDIVQGGFDSFLQQKGRLVIIDFTADWCGPCRMIGPILHKLATERGGTVVVGKVNVDRFPEISAREKVRGIPDVRFYRDGQRVDGFVGALPEGEVRRRIETHAKDLTVAAAVAKPTPVGDSKPKPFTKDWLPDGMQRR